MLGKQVIPFKDLFVGFAEFTTKSFVQLRIFPVCVLTCFCIVLFTRFSSCETLQGRMFKIENVLVDKTCRLGKLKLSFSTISEINCLFICSIQTASDGAFYNYNKATCTCCSEAYTIPDGLPTDEGTRYYGNPDTEGRHDCGDLGDKDFILSGIYEIFPNSQDGMSVFCDFDDADGPWTVIQRRIDDTVDFNRSYIAYQEGFGNLSGNFWLGLDTISSITLQSGKTYSMKVNIVLVDDGEMYAKYTNFHVMNVSDDYTLNVHGYSGNAGDALSFHNGAAFSTYDRDRDTWALGNCAKWAKGGWWFTACLRSFLNGMYGIRSDKGGICWRSGYISFASMKLKVNK